MKRIVACTVLLTSCFAIAASPMADVIKKIVSLQAEKLLVGAIAEEIVTTAVENSGTRGKVTFDYAYYDARSTILYQKDVGPLLHNQPDQDWYWSGRALIVTKLKQYLHQSSTLVDTYKGHYSEIFRKKIAEADPEDKVRIQEKISHSIPIFAALKTSSVKEKFIAFQKAEQEGVRQSDLKLLGRNLTEQEVAAAIEAGELDTDKTKEAAELAFVGMFEDQDLAKFAGRRAVEGGDTLIDQYIAVLELMAQDAK